MKINYELKYKRRRKGQTDYRRRLKLLLSQKPRFIVRKSTKNICAQAALYAKEGDFVKAAAVSQELKKFGWAYSANSLPAAYLTGLLCGARAQRSGINEAVLDMGVTTPISGSKIYACLKGAIDSGLKISADPEIFPKGERLTGAHISSYASALKSENPGKYKRLFSGYLKGNLDPERIPEAFEQVKRKILSNQEVQKKGVKNNGRN